MVMNMVAQLADRGVSQQCATHGLSIVSAVRHTQSKQQVSNQYLWGGCRP